MVKQIGFRPTKHDVEIVDKLVNYYNGSNVVGTATQTDIIRLALQKLYVEVFENEKNDHKPTETKVSGKK